MHYGIMKIYKNDLRWFLASNLFRFVATRLVTDPQRGRSIGHGGIHPSGVLWKKPPSIEHSYPNKKC
jgi:hypothetical protein